MKYYLGGKDNNDVWQKGFYCVFNDESHRIYSGYAETNCGDYYPEYDTVIPETVGQYTGLIDKNGVRIFCIIKCVFTAEIKAVLISHYEWIHLPCNIEKTVYFIRNSKIIETAVEKIVIKKNGIYLKLSCNVMYETSCKSIGKTVFFDREEAEKALTIEECHHGSKLP